MQNYCDPWPDFEGNPPPVSQAMMSELNQLASRVRKIKDELGLAIIDRNAVRAEIEELFILGGGVEPGKWMLVKMPNGQLRVCREEELAQKEARARSKKSHE